MKWRWNILCWISQRRWRSWWFQWWIYLNV